MGCTTFTLLQKDHDGTQNSSGIIDRNFDILTRALTEGVKIPAVRKGRNDIVLSSDGRKISGNAFKQVPGSHVLHHGTILVNSDMSALGRYLSPSKLKLESKGVASVHARVANLTDINSDLSHDEVCGALEKAFLETYPHCKEVITRTLTGDPVTESDVENDEVFREHYEKLNVHLDVIKGRIAECRIFTDALYPDVIGILEEALLGTPTNDSEQVVAIITVPNGYSKESIEEALTSRIPRGREVAGEGGEILVKSFSHWLANEIPELA
ncbi:conserved hypothetical protein [Perkinsus marinus ATCC 50983]|uniref:lipoate--protein ligase n=1 Tax=Perkinsus marinus (strain ATCC 50983 / TXsc) TaxID=423536 RepID=C5L978_PERM5|nr:conserved hypothetical protein [Perkinsus marinus ATCC 50983]EER06726.1 conserved hypothetical protein [Perkinsus marinus ATCC 50983]|eukprot:XP_002774910.1 conserved hypothetical protein [Perkinsus marinus ATCC 50983]